MHIKTELLKEHSKRNAMAIADFIGDDPSKFAELMALFLGNEYRVTQRSAQVVSYCTDIHPQLITPFLTEIIFNLRKDIHVGVKRSTLRILQNTPFPDDLQGDVVDICFRILESRQEPVAVKAFAMTILSDLCQQEPDLKNELRLLIEDQMPYGSAGFRSRGSKVLARLKQL